MPDRMLAFAQSVLETSTAQSRSWQLQAVLWSGLSSHKWLQDDTLQAGSHQNSDSLQLMQCVPLWVSLLALMVAVRTLGAMGAAPFSYARFKVSSLL